MKKTLNSLLKEIPFTIIWGIFLGFLIAFVIFPVTDSYSFKIDCVSGVDFEEFPICEYEDLWNQSEQFNELLVDELSNRANEINTDPELFQKIYSDSFNKINRENPGLYDEGEEIKKWIYEQLVNKVQ